MHPDICRNSSLSSRSTCHLCAGLYWPDVERRVCAEHRGLMSRMAEIADIHLYRICLAKCEDAANMTLMLQALLLLRSNLCTDF